jgi:hypothetical protein
MTYQTINNYNSPNFTPSAQVAAVFGFIRSIDWITIHHWGDPLQNPTFEGVVAWLCNTRSGVSAHDVVEAARVAVIVDYYNAAWHAGNAQGNATSLGHELNPQARDEDYQTEAENIADTWKYYGRIIPLRGHKTWTPTACPGRYDVDRLYNMALAIYNGAPAVPQATVDEIRQAYLDILERPADDGGIKTYRDSGMTAAEVRNDLQNSQEKRDLEARKAAAYAKNEWVRNLEPYTKGDAKFETATELLVLPAEGVKRYNLENGMLLTQEVIPKGTSVSVVAKTRVNGVDYYISRYSKNTAAAVGLKSKELGVPVQPPVQEKPEWLKNLQDIEDKDFWTRSQTPVLDIATGAVTRYLPINSPVRITYATEFVGKSLLVLDGQKEVIETLYLSDKEISNPTADIEKRLGRVETLVKYIMEFLGKLLTGFKSEKDIK